MKFGMDVKDPFTGETIIERGRLYEKGDKTLLERLEKALEKSPQDFTLRYVHTLIMRRMNRMEITSYVSKASWFEGRNGEFEIKAIRWATNSGRYAYIQGISKARGCRLRGGFYIDTEALDRIALAWVRERNLWTED